MKQKIFLILFSFLSLAAKSAENDKFEKICADIGTISAISSQLTVVPWQTIIMTPSGPVPTITMAMISDRGGMTEFCSVYHNLKYAKGADLVFGGLKQLDRMMDGKHSKKISLARNLYDNTMAIHKATKMQGDTLDKMHRIAGRLNSSLRNINDLATEIEGEDPGWFRTRNQQENSMRKQIETAKNITMITGQIRCENKTTPKEGNDPKFVSDSNIKLEELKYIESDIDFLIMSLQRMAIKFIKSNNDFDKFKGDITQLTKETAKYNVSIDKRIQTATEDVQKKGKLESDESTYEKHDKKVAQDYQVFRTTVDMNLQAEFLKKYQPQWDGYVDARAFETLNKTLVRKLGGQAEEEFYDNAYECRTSLMYKKAKETNPGYFVNLNDNRRGKVLKEQRDICRKEIENTDRRVSLFKRYTEELVQSIIKQKGLQGDLWTIDSFFNGTMRAEANGSMEDSNSYAMEDLGCKDTRNTAEQKQIKLETTRQIGDLRQNLLEEKMNQNMMDQQKLAVESKMREDVKLKRELDSEIQRNNAVESRANMTSATDPKGF